MQQVIAAVLASPRVVAAVPAVGRPVVWAEVDSDTAVPLLDTYQAPAGLAVVDTLAGRMYTAGTVAGIAEMAADWPRSQSCRSLS